MMMKTTISPQKTAAVRAEYDRSPEKRQKSIQQYVREKASSDSTFVPWLFDFEQNEDFDNGLTMVHRTAFDNWTEEL